MTDAKMQKIFDICKFFLTSAFPQLSEQNCHNLRKSAKNFLTHGGRVHRGGWSWRGRAARRTAGGSSDG